MLSTSDSQNKFCPVKVKFQFACQYCQVKVPDTCMSTVLPSQNQGQACVPEFHAQCTCCVSLKQFCLVQLKIKAACQTSNMKQQACSHVFELIDKQERTQC